MAHEGNASRFQGGLWQQLLLLQWQYGAPRRAAMLAVGLQQFLLASSVIVVGVTGSAWLCRR